jgi:hypothetical protein
MLKPEQEAFIDQALKNNTLGAKDKLKAQLDYYQTLDPAQLAAIQKGSEERLDDPNLAEQDQLECMLQIKAIEILQANLQANKNLKQAQGAAPVANTPLLAHAQKGAAPENDVEKLAKSLGAEAKTYDKLDDIPKELQHHFNDKTNFPVKLYFVPSDKLSEFTAKMKEMGYEVKQLTPKAPELTSHVASSKVAEMRAAATQAAQAAPQNTSSKHRELPAYPTPTTDTSTPKPH